MTSKRKYRFTVLGNPWVAEVVSHKTYTKREGNDGSQATTNTVNHSILFSREHLSRVVVIHELVHCYVAGVCAEHLGIDKDSFEEIICDMFAKYGDAILAEANSLLAHFATQDSKSQ